MPAKPVATSPNLSFEQAIERLETIVEGMDTDELGLEDLLLRYEEGVQLVRECEKRLNAADRRIQVLTRDPDGEPQSEDFAPPSEAGKEIRAEDANLF